jgi:hypothetical protein
MKSTKLIAIIAFAGFGLCAGQTFAQGNDNNDAPPKMSDVTEEPVAEPYNEKVTIDNNNPDLSTSASGSAIQAQPEQKERLRVYSGNHDGNNVIYDPR